MFFCEMCESNNAKERTDISYHPILCDKCYVVAKADEDDSSAVDEIFKDN